MEFSELSKQLTKQLSSATKKQYGIYFTPPSCIHEHLELLTQFTNNNIPDILEPSFGSGEYIDALSRKFPSSHIVGIESNEQIYKESSVNKNNVELICDDFIKYSTELRYDLIIGNPPYFVMKKEDVPIEYCPYFDGRPNIFLLFIVKSLSLLNDNGILSFVLPKSFLNCLYYDKTRAYIAANYQICHIVACDPTIHAYLDTQQETIILICKATTKTIDNSNFIWSVNGYTIFPLNCLTMRNLYTGSRSLSQLGFRVCIGKVVWNQVKNLLTDDPKQTLLVYSSDINNNQLEVKTYTNPEKKNYINKPGINLKMIVVNRGYGTGEYKFNYCLLDGKRNYLVENHLICIVHDDPTLYKQVIESFQNEKTQRFINEYFGNNAMNAAELSHILPIYIN